MVLRRKATRVQDHQSLAHRIDTECEDHRREPHVSHTQAIDHAHKGTTENAEGNGQRHAGGSIPAAECSRHHGTQRDGPGYRQVNVPQQDHHHGAGCDDAEECADLQLLHEILR